MPDSLDHALWLLDEGQCTPMCLFGMDESCTCRCGGNYHSFLRPYRDRCRCGRQFVETLIPNSGTTDVTEACPVWLQAQRTKGYYREVPGHQYVVATKDQHRATGCCDIRQVKGGATKETAGVA